MSKVEGTRPKTGGRKKGTPNKTTQQVKDAIALVAAGLGGSGRMLQWVQEDPLNERIFWKDIYTKLLPLQLAGDPDNPLKASLEVSFVAPKG